MRPFDVVSGRIALHRVLQGSRRKDLSVTRKLSSLVDSRSNNTVHNNSTNKFRCSTRISPPAHHFRFGVGPCRRPFATTPPPPARPTPTPPIEPDDDEKKDDRSSKSSDPPILTWVDSYLPAQWQPYARLARADKPIGTWLLLWPCFWSTAVAAPAGSLPDIKLLALFASGAFVMRGAGCTINDIWDRDVDARVARTADRPLPSGDVSVPQAVGFLAAQLTTGLAVLLSLPNTWYCFQWGVASLPLVGIYPAMKRFFPYPQLVLGLTFNWGAWMGWAAVHGSIDYSVIAPLYVSGVTWTLLYDTIYAHQDKEDDAKLGLQSTALTFGSDVQTQKQILHALAAATWCQWLLVGYQVDAATVHFVGVTAAYSHLVWQVQTADFEDPHNLAARFRSNSAVGALVFTSLAAGKYFAG
jgi:4-hydroxybenzoate polyprenyltransferase